MNNIVNISTAVGAFMNKGIQNGVQRLVIFIYQARLLMYVLKSLRLLLEEAKKCDKEGINLPTSYLSTFNHPKSGDFKRFTIGASFAAFC